MHRNLSLSLDVLRIAVPVLVGLAYVSLRARRRWFAAPAADGAPARVARVAR